MSPEKKQRYHNGIRPLTSRIRFNSRTGHFMYFDANGNRIHQSKVSTDIEHKFPLRDTEAGLVALRRSYQRRRENEIAKFRKQ